MLTRFRSGVRRDFRVFARSLADKPSDGESKVPPTIQDPKASNNSKSKEKMQELLKLMMSESKNKEKLSAAGRLSQTTQEVKMDKIEESLTKAAGQVAEVIGGDMKQTEAELLSRVLGKINQTSTSLSDLLSGMKVDRSASESDNRKKTETRGQQVKRMVERSRMQQPEDSQSRQRSLKDRHFEHRERKQTQPLTIDLLSGSTLGIFKATKEPNYGTQLGLWNKLKQREVMLATSQPPSNYFQKMINWTEQGKVWQFPINNEQGMEEEQNVHFSEHIFLDTHLEGWCPTKGPIRHFMELVCVGLSKNAFYTVQEKRDHIMWYKEFFESKKDLLTEVGVWEDVPKNMSEAST